METKERRRCCVISGATSGIGRVVADEMAVRGYDLAVIGRDKKKGEILKKEIGDKAPDCRVSYYVADMAIIPQVKAACEQIAADHPVVDVLINNAGGVFAEFERTPAGVERTFANNHLGYYVSTLCLLGALAGSDDARILIVSSASHYRAGLNFDSLTEPAGYQIMKAYAQSKLANILFGYKLADALSASGIAVFCLHPGVVKTPIGEKTDSKFYAVVWKIFKALRGISPERSAEGYIYLATDPEARMHHGEYQHAGEFRKSSGRTYDKDLQERLWKWSAEITGLDLPAEFN